MSVIGTEILARAYKAAAVSPVAVPAWGVPRRQEVSSPPACSAGGALLALYDYRREAAEVRVASVLFVVHCRERCGQNTTGSSTVVVVR